VPDYEGFRALRFVQANVGDVEIQLVEPSPDRDMPQKRFLEEHGEGVYHIGFVVDDVNEGEKWKRYHKTEPKTAVVLT
jgi:4-hydroxyphenylpyruvate dioxygenase-like putative hemolysin